VSTHPTGAARLWRDRPFLTYWTGQTLSQVGDRVSELALPLVAITLLGASATEVGALTAAIWAPNLLALFIGTWVDRRPSRRRLLVVANAVQCLAVASIPAAYFLRHLSMPHLFIAAVVLGGGGVLYQTAYPTFFVRLVHQDHYVQANSLLSTTRSASFIAGPPLAGLLIQTLTAPVALVVDAASFVCSGLLIHAVHAEEPAPRLLGGHQEPFRRRVGLGVRYLAGHPYLRAALACSTTLNFFSFVVQAVIVLYASRDLRLHAAAIGLAFGIGALGGLLGAAVAGPAARLVGAGKLIATGAVLFSLPFALLPLARGTPTAKIAVLAAAEFISAFGIILFDINNNAVQTAVTADNMRSRVSGAYASVNYGIRPIGAVAGGLAAQHFGTPATITTAAIAGALACLWLLRSPVIAVRSVAGLQPWPDQLPDTAPTTQTR